MKACDISPKDWEAVAEDSTAWRQATRRGIEIADERIHQKAAEKRMRRKQNAALPPMSSCFVLLSAARTPTQLSAFTATMDVAKIRKFYKLTTGRFSIVSSRRRSAYEGIKRHRKCGVNKIAQDLEVESNHHSLKCSNHYTILLEIYTKRTQLRCSSHLVHMTEDCISKVLFYGQMITGC